MDYTLITLTLLVALLVLLGGGVWVALSLLGVGILGMELFGGAPAGSILASTSWASSASWTLTALPLFIWMGEILYRTRLSEDMFNGLAPWMRGLPGRLLHVNVFGCGLFAAVSGSSAATAATIGRISLPELKSRGYPEAIAMGSLAGAGTLGLLIPPSIMMIVYGVAAQVSISRLFIAGILPGLLLLVIFSGFLMLWAAFNRDQLPEEGAALPFMEKLRRAKLLIPVLGLIVAVIGSIYAGIATATEAAAVGVVGALLIALCSGALTRETFMASLMGAVCTSCMIFFILLGAAYLTSAMSFTGLPSALADWIIAKQLSPYVLLLALTLFFIALGCFLDGISIILLTTAVVLPAVQAAGIDLLWFGIFVILVVEMAQITPPVGFNLFVIQNLTGHNLWTVAKASFPFFLLLVLAAVLITVFPQIVLALPEAMRGN
ncbi:TRAP transporter, DctM subunit [Pseudomonas cuatrocienegasensis]|uniref:TRAP transporter large permease protein n=1 Tax=Pseudomonas cuatrocienegasensis TaxID=543360 RepID=A0ABY1BAV2_9PSED|nr:MULTISPECIES: TRAP transporter large permease subunit [Pseudomonas]OEC32605.1 C4-dicarboxylate ABC transporter permease [Pseudomonas sp. 21C1]SEQ40171.1 TRAP transporter, DctM subunit [Pseudomonas cuatrocienegasensis]